jgi:hypothetical protein
MPLGRLVEYLTDFAELLGEQKSVHLIRVEEGSTVPVMLVEREAEPKVLERLDAIQRGEAPPEAKRAFERIDEKLRKDNATGIVLSPEKAQVIDFPGREKKEALTYGPFNQPGYLDGIPINVGGRNDPVTIHLEGLQGETYICLAKRSLAKQIAEHLFTGVVRVEGTGRWVRRPNGEWERVHFSATSFTPLAGATVREAVEKLRAIPAGWKQKKDPLRELKDIRHGTEG